MSLSVGVSRVIGFRSQVRDRVRVGVRDRVRDRGRGRSLSVACLV